MLIVNGHKFDYIGKGEIVVNGNAKFITDVNGKEALIKVRGKKMIIKVKGQKSVIRLDKLDDETKTTFQNHGRIITGDGNNLGITTSSSKTASKDAKQAKKNCFVVNKGNKVIGNGNSFGVVVNNDGSHKQIAVEEGSATIKEQDKTINVSVKNKGNKSKGNNNFGYVSYGTKDNDDLSK